MEPGCSTGIRAGKVSFPDRPKRPPIIRRRYLYHHGSIFFRFAARTVSLLVPVPVAKRKKIRLTLSVPQNPTPLIINSDETKIEQVIGNLVSNAIKFTENGIIEMGYTIKNSHIELFVKDEGIGIDPENHSLIFERFRQVEGANSSSITGTGLWLAISKSLVEIMGGEIWVESEKGKGAKFCFTLPLE